MFRRLHPQQSGWNLSLMNIGVTNMIETASEDGRGTGRDISRMFKRQEDVLKEWKIEDRDMPPDPVPEGNAHDELGHTDSNQAEPSAGSEATDSIMAGSEDSIHLTQNTIDDQGQWEDNEDEMEGQGRCADCGIIMPEFAMTAHQLFHSLGE
jgi:DNA polymerase iota